MTPDDPIRDPRTADELIFYYFVCAGIPGDPDCDHLFCETLVPHDWCCLYKPDRPKWRIEIE